MNLPNPFSPSTHMNWEEIALEVLRWLIKNAPDVADRIKVEVLPVSKLFEGPSPAALKLKQGLDLED